MATPITKTWLQLKNLSGGGSCHAAELIVEGAYPGHTDSTVMDALTINNAYRAAGEIGLLYPSIIRGMSGAQQKTLVVGILNKLSNNLPVGWARTAALQSKITDIIDCIQAPTAGKKSALQTFSSSIALDYTDNRETFLAGIVMRAINLTVNGDTQHADVAVFVSYLIKGLVRVKGLDKLVVEGQILDSLETIIGIV